MIIEHARIRLSAGRFHCVVWRPHG